jgi:alpha-glucosidase (family GH31 glycosyl hydrolase)
MSPRALSSPILAGKKARFTVVTASCIRLEFAPDGRFTDESTLFATNRNLFSGETSVEEANREVRLETPMLRLRYTISDEPFNADNLTITLKQSGDAVWTPGVENTGNLRGPIPTLDGVTGPVPLPEGLLSKDGWALIDDSRAPIFEDGWLRPRVAGRDAQDWYFFAYGSDYRAALQSLTTISGAAALPRRHVFGSWYCRWHRYSEDDFRDIVAEYDQHDFPLDVMVMDMDWHTLQDAKTGFGHANMLGWTGWTVDRDLLPNFENLLQEFREDDIRVTLNVHPHDGVRSHEECYPDFMRRLGKDPESGSNPAFNAGSERYMQAYFQAAHEPLEKAGVDFWWVDWQQDHLYPEVPGLAGLKHLPWLNHLYYRHSQKNGRRGLGFSRWGGWGDHRHPIQFSGDTGTSWETLAFEVEFTAVSGNAGCFFWAHDIGGFHGKERDPEAFARWVQFGAVSACLRLHSCGEHLDRRPWKWGDRFEKAMRRMYHLRARLMPYVYTSASCCHRQSVPLLRGMYIDWPEHDEAYANPQQYLFGDHLLAAPITSPGEGKHFRATQTVWLPPGDTWCNWFTSQRYQGGQTLTAEADLDSFPLYVRAGALIPMQPYQRRMSSTPLEHLILRGFAPENGTTVTSELYEDDGQTDAYLHGACATTPFSFGRNGERLEISIGAATGDFDGRTRRRRVTLELFMPEPALARCDAQRLKIDYDTTRGLAVIELPETDPRLPRRISIDLSNPPAQ